VITAETLAAVEGPSWLAPRRQAAIDQFAAGSLPSTGEEVWRYSRIDDLDLDRFAPVLTAPSPVSRAELVRLRSLNPAAIVITVDGALAELVPSDSAGLRVEVATEADVDVLASTHQHGPDAFVALNAAASQAPIVIETKRGALIERPVIVVHVVSTPGALVCPVVVVKGGEASQVTVLEQFVSADVEALVVPATTVIAEQSANVRHVVLQQLGQRVWQIGRTESNGERDSNTMLASVAFGGGYARSRIDARLVGKGASGQQIAIYFAAGDQMHDFRTMQDHRAAKTSSDLLFKGAVGDRAQSVYTGLIRVDGAATGTQAYQTNRNLKLSEHAWAESVPNLDIQTNDVQCSHASAVGPIDADQLFYLESRGVPADVAERLIVLGFFDEVIDRLPIGEMGPLLHSDVATKLAAVNA
jgi:Fe-S cluster assembly protein SufD